MSHNRIPNPLIMYHTEFTLISSKWMFRLDQMTELEQELWCKHLERDGFTIDDMREIFSPFDGEKALHLNEDIGTQELRVRTWNWIDSSGKSHTILDINAWPGDNESGVIAIDGKAIMSNGDQDLGLLDDVDDPFNFSERESFFSMIRIGNDYDPSDDDIKADYDAFFASDAGFNFNTIEKNAFDHYQKKLNEIHNEHENLREKHLPEFQYIEQLGSGDYTEIADKIGYTLNENSLGEFDNRTTFIFIEWKWEDYHRKFVTITEHYNTNTYMLNDNGQIEMMIYQNTYLTGDFDLIDPIMKLLAPRFHSYWHLIRNYNKSYLPSIGKYI